MKKSLALKWFLQISLFRIVATNGLLDATNKSTDVTNELSDATNELSDATNRVSDTSDAATDISEMINDTSDKATDALDKETDVLVLNLVIPSLMKDAMHSIKQHNSFLIKSLFRRFLEWRIVAYCCQRNNKSFPWRTKTDKQQLPIPIRNNRRGASKLLACNDRFLLPFLPSKLSFTQ